MKPSAGTYRSPEGRSLMTVDELRTELARMGVTYPAGSLRACLYLHELQTTYDFFHTNLARPVNMGGLGPGYARVSRALRDPELLNSLSRALDHIIIEAINADLNTVNRATPPPADFTGYFRQYILNNYPANRTAFLNRYPVTRTLIQAIGTNFRNNIEEACGRVINDWNQIQTTFVDDPTGQMQELTKIASSGSDFHKGGKQVLILTFKVRYLVINFVVGVPANRTFNIIYKPGDVEADCLIAGNSAAVNAVHNNFQVNSLFEILNARIAAAKQANSQLELEQLPVYKILPMIYGSGYAAGANPVPVRTAYGYIEYLEHYYNSRLQVPYFGYYPFGTSNFTIFRSRNVGEICRKFYRVIGQLTAVASTFSIRDLHVENLIVKDYLPYLIDMEICFSTLVENVTDTNLFGNLSGVTDHLGGDDKTYTETGNAGNLFINVTINRPEEKNRLWTAEPAALVDPAAYAASICRSLRDMINVIQGAINSNPLNGWLNRVSNNGRGVVVRYLPLGTLLFQGLLSAWYSERNCNNPGILAEFVSIQRGGLYTSWAAIPNNAEDPKFLALQDANVIPDFQNADIPIFFHRVGSLDLVDSRGTLVNVPASISYRTRPGTQPVQANINLGRNTYFAQRPFAARIINTQLQALSANPGRNQRIQTLVAQILADLNLANSPQDVQQILQ